MKRKLLVITMLAVMIVGVMVGVLVWPPPEKALALHPDLWVTFTINWIPFDQETECYPPFDVNATITLLNAQGNPIPFGGPWSADLNTNPEFTEWTYHFTNVTDGAINYRIDWDMGSSGSYEWQDESPLTGQINWETATIAEVADVFCQPLP